MTLQLIRKGMEVGTVNNLFSILYHGSLVVIFRRKDKQLQPGVLLLSVAVGISLRETAIFVNIFPFEVVDVYICDFPNNKCPFCISLSP